MIGLQVDVRKVREMFDFPRTAWIDTNRILRLLTNDSRSLGEVAFHRTS